ncbi:MAG TPA: hypothetical protein VFN37_12055 [Candidatus Baltobacteraceae bacterium]|nr:hypothetical protein [Candidatus Baltobacteraceae bacterium]
MTFRLLLSAAAAAIAVLALAPAIALADLQVRANGFDRVVTSSTQGDTCEVEQLTGGTSIDCPDGSRGTMLFYRLDGESPVCELDFWFGGNGSGAQRWSAQIVRQNGMIGTCALDRQSANAMRITLQPGS